MCRQRENVITYQKFVNKMCLRCDNFGFLVHNVPIAPISGYKENADQICKIFVQKCVLGNPEELCFFFVCVLALNEVMGSLGGRCGGKKPKLLRITCSIFLCLNLFSALFCSHFGKLFFETKHGLLMEYCWPN